MPLETSFQISIYQLRSNTTNSRKCSHWVSGDEFNHQIEIEGCFLPLSRKHRVRRVLSEGEKRDMQRRIEIELENMAYLSRPYLTEVGRY